MGPAASAAECFGYPALAGEGQGDSVEETAPEGAHGHRPRFNQERAGQVHGKVDAGGDQDTVQRDGAGCLRTGSTALGGGDTNRARTGSAARQTSLGADPLHAARWPPFPREPQVTPRRYRSTAPGPSPASSPVPHQNGAVLGGSRWLRGPAALRSGRRRNQRRAPEEGSGDGDLAHGSSHPATPPIGAREGAGPAKRAAVRWRGPTTRAPVNGHHGRAATASERASSGGLGSISRLRGGYAPHIKYTAARPRRRSER